MDENSLKEHFVPSIMMNITKEKISPPRTPKNRLSRSYLKVKNTVSLESTLTQTVRSNESKTVNNVLDFCPKCQIPFDLLTSSPVLHAHNCTVSQDDLEECPEGELCYSAKVLHYQEYSHKYLAQLRASGKEPKQQEFHTPTSATKKRQNENVGSGSELKKKKSSPETQTSPGYRKRLQFGEESANTSSSDNLLCQPRPSQNGVVRKPVTVHKAENSSSSVDLCQPRPSQNGVVRKPVTVHKAENSSSTVDLCQPRPSQNGIARKSEKYLSADQNHLPTSSKNSKVNKPATPHKSKANTSSTKIAEVNGCIKPSESPVTKPSTSCNETVKTSSAYKQRTNGVPEIQEIHCLSKEPQIEDDLQVVFERIPSSVRDLEHDKCRTELFSLSCGYTSKAGFEASEEQLLAEEFSNNFDDTVLDGSVPPKPSSVVSSPNNSIRSKGYSMQGNTSGSTSSYSPVKKRKGRNIKMSAGQNLITTYFQCSKTKLNEIPEAPAANPGTSLAEPAPQASSVQENAAQKWQEIGLRLRKRGYSTLRVFSDASSLSSGQTSTAGFNRGEKRNCPFYKRIPETSFVVDAFSYGIIPGVTVYFLSHFHSDHYGGLRKAFNQPIYCSEITAKLANMKLGVDKKYLNILQLDEPIKIHGVMVTALDANHCPGSLMFLFQLPNGKNYLHVGDFRADPKMESYPCFWNLTIDKLFLDTTYCEPRYKFPAQNEIIAKVVDLAKRHIKSLANTIFVCGSYTIGKEKIFTALAEALDCNIWAGSDKRRVLKCLQDPVIDKRLITNQIEAKVHVCPMSTLNQRDLTQYMQQVQAMCSYLVAFAPTGWETKNCGPGDINMKVYGNITIYGVPYSEHSSFLELRRFVQFLRPLDIIPTVNMQSPVKRAAMQRHFQQWLAESPGSKSGNVQQKLVNYFRAADGADN